MKSTEIAILAQSMVTCLHYFYVCDKSKMVRRDGAKPLTLWQLREGMGKEKQIAGK